MPAQGDEQRCEKKVISFRPRIHQFRLKNTKCQVQTKIDDTNENKPKTEPEQIEKNEREPKPSSPEEQKTTTITQPDSEPETGTYTESANCPTDEVITCNVCTCEPIEIIDRSTQTAFDDRDDDDTKNAEKPCQMSSWDIEDKNDTAKMNTIYLCTEMFHNSANNKDGESQPKICPTCGTCQDQNKSSVTESKKDEARNSNKNPTNKSYVNKKYYSSVSNSDYNTVETTDSEYDIRNSRREQQFPDRNNLNFNNCPIYQQNRNSCCCSCCCSKNNNNAISRQQNSNYYNDKKDQYGEQNFDIGSHQTQCRQPNQRLQSPPHCICPCHKGDDSYFVPHTAAATTSSSPNRGQNNKTRDNYSCNRENPEILPTNGANRQKRFESVEQRRHTYKNNNHEENTQSNNMMFDDQKSRSIPTCNQNKNMSYATKCKQFANNHYSENSEQYSMESNASTETLNPCESIQSPKCPCCKLLAQNVNTNELEKLYQEDCSCSKNKNNVSRQNDHCNGGMKSVGNKNMTTDKYYQPQTSKSPPERRRLFDEETIKYCQADCREKRNLHQPSNHTPYNQRIPDIDENCCHCCDYNSDYETQKRCNAGSNCTQQQQYSRGPRYRYGVQRVLSKHKDINGQQNRHRDLLNGRYCTAPQPQSNIPERSYRKRQNDNCTRNATNYDKKFSFINRIINFLSGNEDEQNEELQYCDEDNKCLNRDNFNHINYKSSKMNVRSESELDESEESECASSIDNRPGTIQEDIENRHQRTRNDGNSGRGRMCGGKQPYYVDNNKHFQWKNFTNPNRNQWQFDDNIRRKLQSGKNSKNKIRLDGGGYTRNKFQQIDNNADNRTQLKQITKKNENQLDGNLWKPIYFGQNIKNKIKLDENKRNKGHYDGNLRARTNINLNECMKYNFQFEGSTPNNIQLMDDTRIENRLDGNNRNRTGRSYKKSSLNSYKEVFNNRRKSIPGQDAIHKYETHHRKYQMKALLCKDVLKYFETTDIATDCETTSCDFI